MSSPGHWRRVVYTPTPSPWSHSSLSCTLRFLGFYISTSKRLTTSSTESLSRNLTSSMYDTQPSVWGALTSSIFISLSFITPTPSHFLSLGLAFSVMINKKDSPRLIRYNKHPSTFWPCLWNLWTVRDSRVSITLWTVRHSSNHITPSPGFVHIFAYSHYPTTWLWQIVTWSWTSLISLYMFSDLNSPDIVSVRRSSVNRRSPVTL
jgi:hypothetical protein